MSRLCRVGQTAIGPGQPLAIIAGPCLLESLELGLETAESVARAASDAGLPAIFKASFDKANRSSIRSHRGPGLEQGLAWLAEIRERTGLALTTDIHEPAQAEPVAETADLIQIPAFLCRQTDLLVAAGHAAGARGGGVNVKKGQFVSPREMAGPVRKLAEAGCENVMVTDRGTFFGYHRLVTDFIGLGELMELDAEGGAPPVCLDCTHATQQPGAGEQTGGMGRFAPLLARAGAAAGVDALFIECHPDPAAAQSDTATQLPLAQFGPLLRELASIRASLR